MPHILTAVYRIHSFPSVPFLFQIFLKSITLPILSVGHSLRLTQSYFSIWNVYYGCHVMCTCPFLLTPPPNSSFSRYAGSAHLTSLFIWTKYVSVFFFRSLVSQIAAFGRQHFQSYAIAGVVLESEGQFTQLVACSLMWGEPFPLQGGFPAKQGMWFCYHSFPWRWIRGKTENSLHMFWLGNRTNHKVAQNSHC